MIQCGNQWQCGLHAIKTEQLHYNPNHLRCCGIMVALVRRSLINVGCPCHCVDRLTCSAYLGWKNDYVQLSLIEWVESVIRPH
jgi:hypothetical protein